EARLKEHEGVREAVVVARGEEAADKRLIAYIVPKQNGHANVELQESQIREWQRLYESTYQNETGISGDFDTTGWTSSYTGKPLPPEEMQSWVADTVTPLRALSPRRVLEIGCGTGLLLTRLAGDCESYIGLDFSTEVLRGLR